MKNNILLTDVFVIVTNFINKIGIFIKINKICK